jgi:hypothetical protein
MDSRHVILRHTVNSSTLDRAPARSCSDPIANLSLQDYVFTGCCIRLDAACLSA